jgi:DNA-directed RNA polymerase subunit beta'
MSTEHAREEVRSVLGSASNSTTCRSPSPRRTDIRAWSYGRGQESRDHQLPHLQARAGGLFCERIFGPDPRLRVRLRQVQAHQAQGRHLRPLRRRGDPRRVRRERMGHIELAVPVVTSGSSSACPRIGLMLDMTARSLEKRHLLRGLHGRHRSGPRRPRAQAAPHRGRTPRSA